MSGLGFVWMLTVIALVTWLFSNGLVYLSALTSRVTNKRIPRNQLWLLVSLPWILPATSVFTLVFLSFAKSQNWIEHHCESHFAHHPHFCFEHLPEMALSFANSLTVSVFVFCLLFLLGFRWVNLILLSRKSQIFERLVSRAFFKNTVDEARPLAFVLGGFNPSIYISTGMKKLLTKRELRMVVSHEAAHIRNNDVVKNYLFEMLLSLHVFPNLIRSDWQLSAELRADRDVAKKFDPLEVADVLIKVRRAMLPASVPTAINGGELSYRINALINEAQPSRVQLGSKLIFLVVLALPFLLVAGHHSLETIWGWLL